MNFLKNYIVNVETTNIKSNPNSLCHKINHRHLRKYKNMNFT